MPTPMPMPMPMMTVTTMTTEVADEKATEVIDMITGPLPDEAAALTPRRRLRLGFRVRVLGFVAALLIFAVTAGLLVQRAVLLRQLDAQVRASLEQERQELVQLVAGRNPATGEPFGTDVQAIFDTYLERNVPGAGEVYVTIIDGNAYASTTAPGDVRLDQDEFLVERWNALVVGERRSIDTAAGPVEYVAVPLRADGENIGVFVVANFLQEEREEIDDFIRVEAIVGAIVVLLTIGAGWVIAGRLLRPLRDLTETARTITDTDLSRRLPIEGNDEIADLAETFNGMLERLETSFATQRRFVDDAGHELRTPITVVRGHLELMGDTPEDRRETVDLVTDELDRMARIVDDLLVLAKAEQPDFVVYSPIELADFTTGIAARAHPLGDRRWLVDATAAGEFLGDSDRLTQAWLNLVRNAVEHTSAGAEIGIGSAWSDGAVRLWVRDTGPGVDPGEEERIFDRFARGHHGPRSSDGAGLGLAIVRSVARAHGGSVELDNRPRSGATFTLVIPPHSSLPEPDDPPDPEADPLT